MQKRNYFDIFKSTYKPTTNKNIKYFEILKNTKDNSQTTKIKPHEARFNQTQKKNFVDTIKTGIKSAIENKFNLANLTDKKSTDNSTSKNDAPVPIMIVSCCQILNTTKQQTIKQNMEIYLTRYSHSKV